MTEPKKSKKKKTIPEAIPIAKKIEKAVVKPTKPSEAVAVPLKARSKEIPVVVANKRPPQTIRVKATTNARGIYCGYRYEIELGKIYTFPDYVANFLIEQNKAF